MLWIGKTKAAGKGNDGLAQRRVSKFICHKVQVYWRHPAQTKPFYRVPGGGSTLLLASCGNIQVHECQQNSRWGTEDKTVPQITVKQRLRLQEMPGDHLVKAPVLAEPLRDGSGLCQRGSKYLHVRRDSTSCSLMKMFNRIGLVAAVFLLQWLPYNYKWKLESCVLHFLLFFCDMRASVTKASGISYPLPVMRSHYLYPWTQFCPRRFAI